VKKWLKEYWWVLVLGVFSSSLSGEIDKITKVIYILILSVFLYIIDYFILKKIFPNTEKKWKKILPWAIGIIIGWFFAETLFWGFFYELGYIIGEWIGSVFS
tara:strand:- start:1339 stop:1644 length:306 start_codon:yes stop_codon:yes gene_type:complete